MEELEYQKVVDLDLQMRLTNKRPIPAYVGYLYAPTINEITDIGLSTYNTYLTLFCSSYEELNRYNLIGDSKVKTTYEWLCDQCLFHKNYEPYIISGLSLFFRERVSFETYVFAIGEAENKRYMSEEIFNLIQDLLKKICCMENIEEEIENPANEKVRQLLEKKKKYNQKLKKLKEKENGEPLNFADLISIYCADGNGADILTVGEYSIYQFNTQFNRMTMLQDYNVNIQALLHGAENKDGIRSWMRKIKVED